MSDLDPLAPGRLSRRVHDACIWKRWKGKERERDAGERKGKGQRRELPSCRSGRRRHFDRDRAHQSAAVDSRFGACVLFLFHRNPQRHRAVCRAEERGRSLKSKASFPRAGKISRGGARRRRRQQQREKEKKKTHSRIQLTGRSAGRDTRPGRRSDARTRQVRRGGESRLHFGASRARAGGRRGENEEDCLFENFGGREE